MQDPEDIQLKLTKNFSKKRKLTVATFLYPGFAVVSFGLVVWSSYLLRQSHQVSALLMFLVLAGMTYSNLVLSTARVLTKIPQLKYLYWLRFHPLFVPLVLVVVVQIAQRTGVVWQNITVADYVSWAIALGLILFGIASKNCFEEAPILVRCTDEFCSIPKLFTPLPAIFTTVMVAVVGVNYWFHLQSPWLLVGALLVFAGNVVPTRSGGRMLSTAIELGFMTLLLATASRII